MSCVLERTEVMVPHRQERAVCYWRLSPRAYRYFWPVRTSSSSLRRPCFNGLIGRSLCHVPNDLKYRTSTAMGRKGGGFGDDFTGGGKSNPSKKSGISRSSKGSASGAVGSHARHRYDTFSLHNSDLIRTELNNVIL